MHTCTCVVEKNTVTTKLIPIKFAKKPLYQCPCTSHSIYTRIFLIGCPLSNFVKQSTGFNGFVCLQETSLCQKLHTLEFVFRLFIACPSQYYKRECVDTLPRFSKWCAGTSWWTNSVYRGTSKTSTLLRDAIYQIMFSLFDLKCSLFYISKTVLFTIFLSAMF